MSARGPRWGSVRAPVDDCMTAASIKDLLDKVVFVPLVSSLGLERLK